MGENVGRNTNTNNESTCNEFTLNTSTPVKIANANPKRIHFRITNNSNHDIRVKFQPESVTDTKDWITVYRKDFYQMEQDNWYTGEISAQSITSSPKISVVEY